MINHLKFINYAHDLASKNFGKTFPNPSVGCIITKNNKIRIQIFSDRQATKGFRKWSEPN